MLFPPKCLGCGKLGPFSLCQHCCAELEPYRGPSCPRCGAPSSEPIDLCPECRHDPPPFRRALTRSLYSGRLESLVRRLKYQDCPQLAKPLALLMAEEWRAQGLERERFQFLTAVPLSSSHLRRRGYNQAALLGKTLAAELGFPYCEALRKVRRTPSQARLKREARLINLRGAFEGILELHGERVLLIDDVMTTGTTARECARTLRNSGAGEVWVYALARGTGSQRISS